jgi:hypothetical protein
MSAPDIQSSFDKWYRRLQELAAERSWNIGVFADRDMWRDYFEDKDSPEEALQDDIDHA